MSYHLSWHNLLQLTPTTVYFNLPAMETFDFAPKDMFEEIPLEDFTIYLIYTLEYRALVMEQISHEREQKYLAEHPNPEDREEGYGVTVMDFTIRDLKGVYWCLRCLTDCTWSYITLCCNCIRRGWDGTHGQQGAGSRLRRAGNRFA